MIAQTLRYLSVLVCLIALGGLKPTTAQTPDVFDAYRTCEDALCDSLFQQAKEVADEASDTTAVGHLLELAEIRKDKGLWDEEAIGLLNQAKSRAASSGDICLSAKVIRTTSSFYLYNEGEGNAIELAEQALDLAEQCGNQALIARTLSTYGVALMFAGEYAAALRQITRAEAIYRELGDIEGQAVALQDMAGIYGSMGDQNKSNGMMLQSAGMYLQVGDSMRYAICITDLCANFLELYQPDSVLRYLPSALDIMKGKHRIGEAMANYNLGEARLQKEQYTQALYHYDDAAKLADGIGFTRFEMEIEISRSQCFTALGQPKRAWQHILRADSIGQNSVNIEGRLNLLRFKMDAAHAAEEHDIAFQSATDLIALSDSLRSSERMQEVAALQESFEAEKREREIEFLSEKATLETQKKNALIGLVFVVFAGAVLVINRESKRRKKAKQLHQTEIALKEANEQRLQDQLKLSQRELTSRALLIAQKNEVLERLREKLRDLSAAEIAQDNITDALSTLQLEKTIDNNWAEFTRQFKEVNPVFYQSLQEHTGSLTANELRLAALLKMNLSSKEIAAVLNITPEGVKKARQRFRKKLGLQPNDGLEAFIAQL